MISPREIVKNRSYMSLQSATQHNYTHTNMRTQDGFSLIELIVTVVIIAVFGSMIIVFFGSSIIKSSDPITRLRKTTDLHKVMENITADYNKYPKWKASTSYATDTVVIPTNVNGRCYKCTTPGTSSTSEPTWPLTTSGTVTDGAAVWTENGKVHDATSLTTLQTNINNNIYGSYIVVENKFIKFTGGNEVTDANGPILKVSIKNDTGETLTALFMVDYLL